MCSISNPVPIIISNTIAITKNCKKIQNIAKKLGSISVRLPSDLPYAINSQCHNLETRNAISSEIPLDEEFLSAKVVAQGKIKEGTISCNLSSNYGPISIFTN